MQSIPIWWTIPPYTWFQSSPGQKAGCNRAVVSTGKRGTDSCFNPHPARRPDAISVTCTLGHVLTRFNPHPARRPDAMLWQSLGAMNTPPEVSILTRPEGRMQSTGRYGLKPDECRTPDGFNPHPARRPDAIRLGWVKRHVGAHNTRFQSSPGQKAGCNAAQEDSVCVFQSSPGQKAGCNARIGPRRRY